MRKSRVRGLCVPGGGRAHPPLPLWCSCALGCAGADPRAGYGGTRERGCRATLVDTPVECGKGERVEEAWGERTAARGP